MVFDPRFVIVSLGNPAPYAETLHSVGHFVLQNMVAQMQRSPRHLRQPSFAPARYGGETVLASVGPKYTLLQSPTLMNVTGPWLEKVWKHMLRRTERPVESQLMLAIVHDDLELELGHVKLRQWSSSARGHNGVKSAQAFLPLKKYGDFPIQRIAVGIGRPRARDAETVAKYVLRPMTAHEKEKLERDGGLGALKVLEEYEQSWRRQEEEKDKTEDARKALEETGNEE